MLGVMKEGLVEFCDLSADLTKAINIVGSDNRYRQGEDAWIELVVQNISYLLGR
jgi:hypothetical protein